jgi:hypothetical protein
MPAPGTWIVDFHDTKTGKWMARKELKAEAGGGIKIDCPGFEGSVAMKMYRK